MIDIEEDVYTVMKTRLPSFVTVRQYYQEDSKKFPLVTVEEISNAAYTNTIVNGTTEVHSLVGYEVSVYTNGENKKLDAKEIMRMCDTIMTDMCFVRSFMSPVPNMNDSKVYRINARYTAVVDQNKNIFRR